MKISKMITELETAMKLYGDLPIFTYDGEIGVVRIIGSKDGLPPRGEKPTEIVIEIQTKWVGK